MTEALVVDRFDGGITDNWLNGPPNCAQKLENWVVTDQNKLAVRGGSEVRYPAQLPTGNQRIGFFANLQADGQYYAQSGDSLFKYLASPVWSEIRSIASNLGFSQPAFYDLDVAYDFANVTSMRGFGVFASGYFSPLFKVYSDQISCLGMPKFRLRTTGTPTPTVTLAAGASNLSYQYCFMWKQVLTTTSGDHVFFGYPLFLTADGSSKTAPGPGNAASVYINLQDLKSAVLAAQHILHSNLSCALYRTTDGGTTFYHVSDIAIPNEAGVNYVLYDDTMTDAVLDDREKAYFTGGSILAYGEVSAKYVTTCNDMVWAGAAMLGCDVIPIEGSSTTAARRVRHSLKGSVGLWPYECYVTVDDDIVGISSVDEFPIVFTKRGIVRLEGYIDAQGKGSIRKKVVSTTRTALNHNCIIKTDSGIYFASHDGFYFTDGFRIIQTISKHLRTTYASFVADELKQKRMTGVYLAKKGLLCWAVSQGSATSENDLIVVCDPSRGNGPEERLFWTISGPFLPSTIAVDTLGNLIVADARGYVLTLTDSLKTDAVVDPTKEISEWGVRAVQPDYISPVFSFGTETNKKWISTCTTHWKKDTEVSIQPQSRNDLTSTWNDMREIRYRSGSTTGENKRWNLEGTVIATRDFPKRKLRCTYKQLRLIASTTVLYKSDDYCTGVVNATLKTITLSNSGSFDWPADALVRGQSIYLENDTYTRAFEITARSDDTLTLADSGNNLVNGTFKWMIKGRKRDERPELLAYSIPYSILGMDENGFTSGETGVNQ